MSNCIQVGSSFAPFRWVGDRLEAWVGGRWQEVVKTGRKNDRREWIFRVK